MKSRPGASTEAANHSAEEALARVTDSPDIPEYLSPEWWALDRDDWRWQAAIVVAANRWHTIATSVYGWDLFAEAGNWHLRRTFSDWSSTVAEMVKGRRLGPSYRELTRRRAVLGPNYRRYSGGPVDWETGRPAVAQKATVAKGAA